MDRRAKMELFAEIPREYQYGVGTIKAVSRAAPGGEALPSVILRPGPGGSSEQSMRL